MSDGSALTDLVIVSGLSGAGKSSAMQVFEDAGYFCVDNLPAEMIRSLADLFQHKGSKVEHACVVSDLRGGEYFEGLAAVLDELSAQGVVHRVVFLWADEQTLLNRYKETRRRHPLAPAGAVTAGIAGERALLAPLEEHADAVVDTTGVSATGLRRRIAEEFLPRDASRKLAVTFQSFVVESRASSVVLPPASHRPGVTSLHCCTTGPPVPVTAVVTRH